MSDDNKLSADRQKETSMQRRTMQRRETAAALLAPNDILVGRGFQYEGHPGNMIFYQTVDAALGEYFGAPTKKEKTSIVKRIYGQLSCHGRFVRYDTASGTCVEIDPKEARQKISHALRYRRQDEPTTPAPVPMPPDYMASSFRANPEPLPEYSRFEVGSGLTRTGKRSSDAVAHITSAPPPKMAHAGDDGSSGSGLFSESKLQDALGRPGEIEIAALHSLEDFSIFGATTHEPEFGRDTSTRQLKSPPNVPDAVILNSFGESPTHHSISQEEGMVASFAAAAAVATGTSSVIATMVHANSSGDDVQLSEDTSVLFPMGAYDGRGDAIGGFGYLERSSPNPSAINSPFDLETKAHAPPKDT